MSVISFTLNGKKTSVDVDPDTPLLWVLRDTLGLTGTKYSCGKGLCGSCTVHINGEATRSCITPVGTAANTTITTIEGLGGGHPHPVQDAWIKEEVPQCGYCQSGQVMAAAALLAKHPSPTEDQIAEVMDDVLCRCGTYQRIRKAIHRAAEGGAR